MQPTLSQTRLLNFFGTFANDAEGKDEATTEDRCNLIAVLLEPLIELTGAKDHSARWWVDAGCEGSRHSATWLCPFWLHYKPFAPDCPCRRFCQLVHALVGNLPQNVEPSDALDAALGQLEEAMLVGGGALQAC